MASQGNIPGDKESDKVTKKTHKGKDQKYSDISEAEPSGSKSSKNASQKIQLGVDKENVDPHVDKKKSSGKERKKSSPRRRDSSSSSLTERYIHLTRLFLYIL